MLLIHQLKSRIPDILDKRPVAVAYVHGSVATGRSTSLSDLDLALVTDRLLSPSDRFRLERSIAADVNLALNVNAADVRVIDDAPLTFQGEVVTNGIPIYCRNEDLRIAFETKVRTFYLDFLPALREIQYARRRRFREVGLLG